MKAVKLLVLTLVALTVVACSGYQYEGSQRKDQHIDNQLQGMSVDDKTTVDPKTLEVAGHPVAPYEATCEGVSYGGCYATASAKCGAHDGFSVFKKTQKLGQNVIYYSCTDY